MSSRSVAETMQVDHSHYGPEEDARSKTKHKADYSYPGSEDDAASRAKHKVDHSHYGSEEDAGSRTKHKVDHSYYGPEDDASSRTKHKVDYSNYGSEDDAGSKAKHKVDYSHQGQEDEADGKNRVLLLPAAPPVPRGPNPNVECAEEAGQRIYALLLTALFAELDLYADRQNGLLDASKQLLVYHHAAALFEARDAVLALLRQEEDPLSQQLRDSGLSDVQRRATTAARKGMRTAHWRPSVLRGKRVFGHRDALRPVKLPNLPEGARAASVYLPERPSQKRSKDSSFFGNLFKFQASDPLGRLDDAGLGLVLSLGEVDPGAHVVISPFLTKAEETALGLTAAALRAPGTATGSEARRHVTAFVGADAEAWRGFLAGEDRKLLTPASLKTVKSVLRNVSAPPVLEARAEFLTPQKPLRQPAKSREAAGKTPDPPEEESTGHSPQASTGQIGPRAYVTLMMELFKRLNLYHTEENFDDWLDMKKQLLIYHHAAKLSEVREAVLSAIRGDEEDQVANLPEAYRAAVGEVRENLVSQLAAAGEKAKRIFAHEQVIRFHQPPKGLPVPRTCCIFLRELPQISGYRLKQTPSLFRDLIRFKGVTNALTMLEERGLALVLNVVDRTPRAFLVISPLFEHPDVVEEAVAEGKTWADIEFALKDHIGDFICRDAEAWRTFMQRHADVITKESLRIIQKALKSGKPSAAPSTAMDTSPPTTCMLEESREIASMSLCELEIRVASRVGALEAEAIVHCQEAEVNRAALEAARLDADAAREACEKSESQRADLETRKAALEARRAELEASLGEATAEAECLLSANAELLNSTARASRAAYRAAEKRAILRGRLARIPVLKRLLKDSKRHCKRKAKVCKEVEERKEALQAELQEVNRRLLECQEGVNKAKEATSLVQKEVASREQAIEELKKGEARIQAELEVKAATVERLQASNVELRAEAARSKESAEAAQREVAAMHIVEKKLRGDLKHKEEALSAADDECNCLRRDISKGVQEMEEAQARAIQAEFRASEAKNETVRANADLRVQSEEVMRLGNVCLELRGEISLAKAREEQARDTAAKSEEALGAAKQTAKRIQAELDVKAETAERLSESNTTLRAEAKLAQERADSAEARASKAEEAEKATRTSLSAKLTAKEEELSTATSTSDALRERAEHAEAEARRLDVQAESLRCAELRLRSELRVATEEVARLAESCTSLRTELDITRKQAEEDVTRLTESCTALRAELDMAQKQAAEASRLASANADLEEELKETKAGKAQAEQAAKEKQEASVEAARLAVVNGELAVANAELEESIKEARAGKAKAEQATRTSEQALVEARRLEARIRAELEVKGSMAAQLGVSNASLRAEASQAQAKCQKATERATSAEETLEELRNELTTVRAQLQKEEEEAKAVKARVECAEAEAAKASEEARESKDKAAETQQAAIKAKAECEVQAAEAARLESSCATLMAQVSKSDEQVTMLKEEVFELQKREQEARQAEQRARAELEVRVQTAEQLTASNAALRAEASAAQEQQVQASTRAEEAEKELVHLRASEVEARSELRVVKEEAATAEAARVAAEAQRAASVEEAQQAKELAAEAEQTARKARAEAQAKTEEASRVEATCANLMGQVAKLEDRLQETIQRAEEATRSETEAKRAVMQARGELEAKSETVTQLSNTNATLRAEASKAREAKARATALVEEAQQSVEKLRASEAQARADLHAKQMEVASLITSRDALRAEINAAKVCAREADERAQAAEATETASRAAALKATAEAKAKSEEAARLSNAYVCLRSEAANAREAAERSSERLAETERRMTEVSRSAAQVRAELEAKAASNVAIRTEMLAAQRTATEATAAAAAARADAAASEARAAKAWAELRNRAGGASELDSAGERQASSAREEASHRARMAEEAAQASRQEELRARAQLLIKGEELARLQAETNARLGVSLETPDLAAAEVQRLAARGPQVAPGAREETAVEEPDAEAAPDASEEVSTKVEAEVAAATAQEGEEAPTDPEDTLAADIARMMEFRDDEEQDTGIRRRRRSKTTPHACTDIEVETAAQVDTSRKSEETAKRQVGRKADQLSTASAKRRKRLAKESEGAAK